MDLDHELRENVSNLRWNLNNDDYVIRNYTEFHQLIAEAAQNTTRSLVIAPIGALLIAATVDLYSSVTKTCHRLLQAQEAILSAVLYKDPVTAEKWMVVTSTISSATMISLDSRCTKQFRSIHAR